jgi:hypothetical protein
MAMDDDDEANRTARSEIQTSTMTVNWVLDTRGNEILEQLVDNLNTT